MRTRHLYYAVSALSLMSAFSIGARAQTADANPAEAVKVNQLEEVVVTANRREENLQDVPITVTAVSAETMAATGIQNIQDLKVVVPGLAIGNAVGFATTHLRGVGSTTIAPGVENPIAIYVDGVYQASSMSGFLDFIDVDNVQVLKGPQGTLFGRNATGGLIQVTTQEPSHTLRVDAEGTYGNYDAGKGSVYIADGITDDLAASFAFQMGGQGDGYGTNLLTGDPANKSDLSLQTRTKWVYTPSADTKITAELDYNQQRNDFNGARLPPGASNFAVAGYPNYGSPWDINENINPVFTNRGGGGSLKIEQDLGFARLTNIAAFRMDHSQTYWDLYQSAVPFFDGILDTQERQMSEELQLSSEQDSPIIWTGGLFYFNYESAYDPNTVHWGPATPIDYEVIPGIPRVASPDSQLAQSYAAFAQATGKVTPDTDVTLGLRYTLEKHHIHGDQLLELEDFTPIVHVPHPGESKQFEKPTFRMSVDHHFDEDTLAYVSFNTGFKSGGFNTGSIADPAYQPEKLNAYEVGVKSELLEHKLRLNGAAFHYDYTNIQVQKIEGGNTGIINGGAAEVNGLDLDFQAHVTDNFSITGSGEYLDAKFTSFPGAPISNSDLGAIPGTPAGTVVNGDATGKQLPYASHFSFSVAGNYIVPLGNETNLDLNVTLEHVGSFYLEPDNVMQQKPYNKLNASLKWAPDDDNYSVMLWGKNITNEAVFTYGGTLLSGLHTVQYEPPATYGVTFAYHFRAAPAAVADATPPAPPVAAPAPAPVAQPEAQREFQVFFDFDKSVITDAASRVIAAAADVVKKGGVAHVTVTGHTDTVGSAVYNQGLSERRAAAVKSKLVADGVPGGEITTNGVGKTGLLVPTADGVREPQNRRAVIDLR